MLHALQEVSVLFCGLLEVASSCRLKKAPHNLPWHWDSIFLKTYLRWNYSAYQTVKHPYCRPKTFLPVKNVTKQLLEITCSLLIVKFSSWFSWFFRCQLSYSNSCISTVDFYGTWHKCSHCINIVKCYQISLSPSLPSLSCCLSQMHMHTSILSCCSI